MSVRNPLAGVPLRAARWSATHPWRAILAWFVFVLVAVGLAIAIPTQEPTDADYRLGESGRADAMVDAAGLDGADTENVLITARGDAVVDQQAAESAAAEIRRDMAAIDGVDAVSEPQWNPDQSALLMEIQLAKDQEDVAALRGRRPSACRTSSRASRSARPATSPSTRASTSGSPTTCPRPRRSASR